MLAQRELSAARAAAEGVSSALQRRDFPSARAGLTEADRHTARAEALTDDVVWRGAARAPYAGRSFTTVAGLAAEAHALTASVLPALLAVGDALDAPGLRSPGGQVDFARLRGSAPGVQAAAVAARDARQRVRALPVQLVPRPVRAARRELLTALDDLATSTAGTAEALELAPVLLGERQKRRYFVLVQQPGESRGTGGLPAAFAVVEADRGRLQVTERGNTRDLPPGDFAPPPDLPPRFVSRYGYLGAFYFWSNINLSPDLPVVAHLIDARWSGAGRAPLDGVITLDPTALQLLLEGGAPLDLGGGAVLRPDQVQQFLELDQYRGVSITDDQAARKERLQSVAAAAVDRLTAPSGTTPVALVLSVAKAIRSGHLRVASDRPDLAGPLRSTGLDGALPRGAAPVAYPVVNNFAGSKLETWLSRSLSYRAGPCVGTRRRSTIDLRLTNDPPADLPPYVKFDVNVPGQQSTTSRLRVSLYGTHGARLLSYSLDGRVLRTGVVEEGQPPLGEDVEAGLPVWDVTIELKAGQERRIVLELDEPVARGAARLPEQPLARPLRRHVDVPVCS